MEKNSSVFDYIAEELKEDREVALTVVKTCGLILEQFSQELKQDRDIVMAAMRQNGKALLFAPHFLNDKECVKIAVRSDANIVNHLPNELKDDRESCSH